MTARIINCHPRHGRPGAAPARDARGLAPVRRGKSEWTTLAPVCAVVVAGLVALRQPANPGLATAFMGAALVWLLASVRGPAHWARWARWAAVLLGGGCLFWPDPLLGAAAAACAVWLWPRRPRYQRPRAAGATDRDREAAQAAGMLGERRVAATLERGLPDGYVVVNGLMLPRGAGDIDHLVVGPTGVFLLETKTMAGLIECGEDGTWHRTRRGRGGTPYAAFIGDPATQAERNIRAVRAVLNGRGGQSVRHRDVWITGLIVFAHPDVDLSVGNSRVAALVLDDLVVTIVSHTPRRALLPRDVDELVDALLADGAAGVPAKQSAQAVVELALVLPALLAVVFGIVVVSRLVQTQMALVAVAQEAARAGALATTPESAAQSGVDRGEQVAANYGLHRGQGLVVALDARQFRSGGKVLADATYTVDLTDVPLLGWASSPTVHAEHVEWVDPYRSGLVGP